MLKNKEPMIVYPFSGGGYAVRPINWAGIWDENGKLKSSCNVTAVFTEEGDAKEYCRIMNEPLRMAGMILNDELNKRGDWYKTTMESLVQIIYGEYEADLDKAHEVVYEWLEKRLLPKNPMYGSAEGSFTVENNADFQNLMEMLMGELKTVDITGYSDEVILRIVANMDGIEKLVTTDPKHYEMLAMSKGYTCNSGGNDILYGVPIVLDQYKKLNAAKIRFEKRGSD